MLKTLLPYIKLYRHYFFQIILGILLVLMALAASIFLFSLSGWFLSAAAFVGVAGLYTFNYMLPAAGVRATAITRTVSRYFERLVNHDVTFKILSRLRQKMFNKVLPLSAKQLQNYQKADLLNRFIADIDHLDHLYLRLFTPIISGIITSVLIYAAMSYFNSHIALILVIFLLCAILILPIIFYQLGKDLGSKAASYQRDYRLKLVDYLQGQTELTLFDAKKGFIDELNHIESQILYYQNKQTTLQSIAGAIIVLVVGAMTMLILYHPANNAVITSNPIMALFVFISLATTEVLAPIPAAFIFLGHVLASAKRMNHLNELKPDVIFAKESVKANLASATIELKDVSFSYPNQPNYVLSHLNLQFKNGEHVAINGETGCGKSTLLNLLTKSWQINHGQILINQHNINDYDEPSLRSMMSVVPQVITIFNDTLRNNLLLANQNASDDELIAVLKSVELDKLLQTPDGLDLLIGNNARALSGGEKRRIGIARALLKNAPLILLDEPTESLDSHTEQQIITLIKQSFKHKTMIMVTHRLTSHEMFDKIVKLT